MAQKGISIIFPVYNECDNIPLLYQKVTQELLVFGSAYWYELIFVNDGSTDSSWDRITELAHHDARVKGICFSRNFGHQVALKAGYDYASGDAVISMDADLEHPPSTVPAMIAKWQQGAKVVYVRRVDRKDFFLKRWFSVLYYRLLNGISDVAIPHDVADFRLVDKQVINVLRASKERSLYLRGLVAWTGFNHEFVEVSFDKRSAGRSSYTLRKMVKLAFDGFANFSLFPLKIAAFMGIFVIVTGVGMFGYITVDFLLNKVHYPLFKWLVTVIYIFMGIQFLLLWIVGEYIGRIYEQQKGRLLYVIDETVNVDTLKQ